MTAPNPEVMRTFRMVAEPGRGLGTRRSPTLVGLVCVDVVLRGQRADVDAVTPNVKAFLDTDCTLIGSWVDEGTERETVTFTVASAGIAAVRDALQALVDAHDEEPSMLTATEWERARTALSMAGAP